MAHDLPSESRLRLAADTIDHLICCAEDMGYDTDENDTAEALRRAYSVLDSIIGGDT
jgi:hypothetical protein